MWRTHAKHRCHGFKTSFAIPKPSIQRGFWTIWDHHPPPQFNPHSTKISPAIPPSQQSFLCYIFSYFLVSFIPIFHGKLWRKSSNFYGWRCQRMRLLEDVPWSKLLAGRTKGWEWRGLERSRSLMFFGEKNAYRKVKVELDVVTKIGISHFTYSLTWSCLALKS